MFDFIAAMFPTSEEGGFAWGEGRKHVLVPATVKGINDLLDEAIDAGALTEKRRANISEEELSALASGRHSIEDVIPYTDVLRFTTYEKEPGRKTFLEVLDMLPSAGDGSYWHDDIWLGIADYLSVKTWSDIFGCPDEASYYIFPGEDTFTEDEKKELREYIPNIWEDKNA